MYEAGEKMMMNRKLLSCTILVGVFAAIASLLVFPFAASAKVTGLCSNCHTMHNSQNGSAVARTGSGMGWNGSGKLTGGSIQGPQADLLVTDCVGCHSSTTNQTIINVGSSRVPIVFNTVAPSYNTPGPSNALAGGNFYWVKNVNDNRGHNVYGISGQDSRLTQAPGRVVGCFGSCHDNLANPTSGGVYMGNGHTTYNNGCQGCHVETSHHVDNGWYRFLKGHYEAGTVRYVAGLEDADWEQTTNATKHNYYKGTTDGYAGALLGATHTITSFCSGCHYDFHGWFVGLPNEGTGYASPWMRHPTDIALPQTDEYNGYDPVNSYSVEAPVAWLEPANPTRAGAVVMCLSCHRAHGSPYPSMLRWDYNTMVAGGGGSGGCFTCHTQKK